MKHMTFKLADIVGDKYHPGEEHEYDDRGYCTKCWEIILNKKEKKND